MGKITEIFRKIFVGEPPKPAPAPVQIEEPKLPEVVKALEPAKVEAKDEIKAAVERVVNKPAAKRTVKKATTTGQTKAAKTAKSPKAPKNVK